MINLKITNKDMEMLTKKLSNAKTFNKNNGKDFLKILENQKFDLREIKNAKTDGAKQNKGKEVENEVKAEKPIEKDEKVKKDTKTKEDIKDELVVLINSIYDLILKTDIEPEELEELNLESLKTDIVELSTNLEQLLSNDILSFDEVDMLEAIEKFEDLIMSFDKELNKITVNSNDKTINLPEEVLSELNQIKDDIKLIIDNNSMAMERDNIKFEDEENELNLNNLESTEIEFEGVLDKEKDMTTQKETIVKNMEVEEAEETKVEDIDNNNPLFEIIDRSKVHEKTEIKNDELQEVDKKEVIQQIVDKVKLIVDDYKQEIRIRLKPEILGELMLKMEVVKGDVLAKIIVDNHRTKELIEANLFQLKEDMKENGLEIKTFEVFVGTNEDFDRENAERFNFKKRPNKIKIKAEELKEIEIYNENTLVNMEGIYEEGQLNLFA
ncbi:MAG: flagellar hook-length control protein FliK [Tissierellia bacterium]|nr:flagellar hook-length control protein FliK [Tissierellia bacterium]